VLWGGIFDKYIVMKLSRLRLYGEVAVSIPPVKVSVPLNPRIFLRNWVLFE
jgi:hypothetical protein